MSEACKIFDVKFITTNTRLGFVNVDEICDKSPMPCDRAGAPDNIYHAAIIAYGSVYEYIFNKGIVISEEKKYLEENSPIWFDGSFQVEKSKEEFEDWVNDQSQSRFRIEDYHMSDCNCSHFTRAIGEHLGGTEPFKHSGQRDWLIKNRHIAILIQEVILDASRDFPKTVAERDGKNL